MKIFFIGTVQFSYEVLEELVKRKFTISGVATKAASAFNSDFADLTNICLKENIPFKFVNDINHSKNIEFVRECKPDVIYCFGWSSLLKTELLKLPRFGVVGFHPAALPENKGRHPIIWALVLGLHETASTFFLMDEGADSGTIVSQEHIKIAYEDDAASLYKKITTTALKQVVSFTQELTVNGGFVNTMENIGGNTWRKRGAADGKIDFRMTSRSIYNLVRGLTKPYVGAHIQTPGKNVLVWKVIEERFDKPNIEPGKVLHVEDGTILIKTSDGAIRILEHDFGDKLPSKNDYFI